MFESKNDSWFLLQFSLNFLVSTVQIQFVNLFVGSVDTTVLTVMEYCNLKVSQTASQIGLENLLSLAKSLQMNLPDWNGRQSNDSIMRTISQESSAQNVPPPHTAQQNPTFMCSSRIQRARDIYLHSNRNFLQKVRICYLYFQFWPKLVNCN